MAAIGLVPQSASSFVALTTTARRWAIGNPGGISPWLGAQTHWESRSRRLPVWRPRQSTPGHSSGVRSPWSTAGNSHSKESAIPKDQLIAMGLCSLSTACSSPCSTPMAGCRATNGVSLFVTGALLLTLAPILPLRCAHGPSCSPIQVRHPYDNRVPRAL